ncbi:MAG: hypothetical protein V1897_13310 [Pseudomonadota bacterium]
MNLKGKPHAFKGGVPIGFFTRRRIKSEGLVLLEILISVVILVFIGSAVSLIFDRSSLIYRATNAKNKVAQESSIAMEWLMRDISQADCIYEVNTTNPDNNYIVLRNPASGYMKYYLQTSTTLARNDGTINNYSLIEDVDSLSLNFSPFDWQNQPTTFASKAEEIEITLTASADNQTFSLYTVAAPTSCTAGCLFAKSYGSNIGTDDPNSLTQTSDGGFIFGGRTTSFGTGGDFLAIRTDGAGGIGPSETWAKFYGGLSSEQLNSLAQTFDLNHNPTGYILGGNTTSYGANSNGDFLAIRTDSLGGLTGSSWKKFYGGTGVDEIRSLAQTFDTSGSPTGYILGGYTTSFGTNGDFLVIKTGDDGLLGASGWSKNFGGNASNNLQDQLNSLAQTKDEGYILGGTTTSFPSGNTTGSFLVIKITPAGSSTWAKFYGGANSEDLRSLAQTFDTSGTPSGYILGGTTTSFPAGNTNGDFLVIKTDSDGLSTTSGGWRNAYGSTSSDTLTSLAKTSDGGYILGGNTTSFGTGGDILVIKTLANGTLDTSFGGTGAISYGGTGLDQLRSLKQTLDENGSPSGYILAGYTTSFGTGNDFLLIKIDVHGNIISFNSAFTATPRTVTVTNIPTGTDCDGSTAGISESAPSITPNDALTNFSTGDAAVTVTSVCP